MSKMKVYLDNAATTSLDPQVLEVVKESMSVDFGNPSSSHSEGRKARAKLEYARKSIAKLFMASSSEFIFTSGGTEANNLAIQSVLCEGSFEQVITTDLEHHAVLTTIEHFCALNRIRLIKLTLDEFGEISLLELEQYLSLGKRTFVSLMHGNNEIGNLLPLREVSVLCEVYGAVFHCDTVQTIGHKLLDLSETKVDFITCSAHKIHGPKGVGFLYTRGKNKLTPLFFGGGQERGVRPGTENLPLILGMEKALALAYGALQSNEDKIKSRRLELIQLLRAEITGLVFNGSATKFMSTVVSVQLDTTVDAGMLLFQLDLKGICVSGGSACSSGSLKGSHVLSAIQGGLNMPSLRFSLSRNTTSEELRYAVDCLKQVVQK